MKRQYQYYDEDFKKTIVNLYESYEPSILANFKIEDEEKKLVLTKTKNR